MDYLSWIPERIAQLRMQKGISARDMSLSLGQSESYINKIENSRTLPFMTGFLYICEFLDVTPQEFFDTGLPSPQNSKQLLHELQKLTPAQMEHILQVVRDIWEKTDGPRLTCAAFSNLDAQHLFDRL
ncbi:MAG: helix-turn-helix transcriptional regulator [Oscillibacter sp.]|nr:helix-turn-helix transcriptional regulator [Oscillibacter sp.]